MQAVRLQAQKEANDDMLKVESLAWLQGMLLQNHASQPDGPQGAGGFISFRAKSRYAILQALSVPKRAKLVVNLSKRPSKSTNRFPRWAML